MNRMIFRITGRDYGGRSAVEIVRALEGADYEYPDSGGSIRDYLKFCLNRFAANVSARDLDLSERLGDETLALSYLLLLDEYGLGEIVDETDKCIG